MVSRNCLVTTTLLLVITGLVACSTGPRRQTYWVNPGYGPELQQQRFTLDSTECAALANRMIPEPTPPPQPQRGTIFLDTPRGGTLGTYESQPPTPQGWQPDGFLGGYLRAERDNKRRDYAAACMGNRGWQQRQRIIGQ